MPNKVRIDKWLWSIRIYKSRSIATAACKAGKVKVNDKNVKASYSLELGQTVTVNKKEKKWIVKPLKLIEKRVGAEIAQSCYKDLSPPVESNQLLSSFFYQSNEKRKKGDGRPTKRERRMIDKFKGNE